MDHIAQHKAATAAAMIEAKFVGRTSIVHIPDGRAFCGTFLCVDSGLNIILANTDETRTAAEGRTSTRNVGMVMIPGDYVVKVEIQEDAPQPNADSTHDQKRNNVASSSMMAQAGWPDDDDMYS
ncbi:hypothetical protein NDA16_003444 [Ustilago loliicola]|nr:hypothetical protein NDA16_003444 [Ustilago loliicola]